jgi:hypothetical protein
MGLFLNIRNEYWGIVINKRIYTATAEAKTLFIRSFILQLRADVGGFKQGLGGFISGLGAYDSEKIAFVSIHLLRTS